MTSSNHPHSLRPLKDLWDVIAHDEWLEVVTAHFLPGDKGNLVSDFHTWLGGNFSGDLTRGTVLTSLVVDFLHGKLPPHEHQTAIGDHLGQLIDRLVRLGRTVSTTFPAMHAVDSVQLEDETNRTLFSEIVFHLWHDVCALRRILVRIERALNTSLFSAALNASKFDSTITGKTIQEISNLNSTITRELLLRSKTSFHHRPIKPVVDGCCCALRVHLDSPISRGHFTSHQLRWIWKGTPLRADSRRYACPNGRGPCLRHGGL